MRPKFAVGDIVRYVGELTEFSPPKGTVGKVLKISNVGTDFKVKFPEGTVPMPKFIMHKADFWYSDDELELIDDTDIVDYMVEMANLVVVG